MSKDDRPAQGDGATARSETDQRRNKICSICQQPVGVEESVQWRGKPVHPDCL